MNIFFTDPNPVKAARNLDDKRVIKMILESAQMLCTALHFNKAANLAKYKSTHANHPSNVWVRATDKNYEWLLMHFEALCTEYTYRYGKIHASASLLADLKQGKQFIPTGDLQPFANCAARQDMNLDMKWMNNTVNAYRYYMMKRWLKDTKPPKWTNRPPPKFLQVTKDITDTLIKLGLQ